jgi:hypothetical protein
MAALLKHTNFTTGGKVFTMFIFLLKPLFALFPIQDDKPLDEDSTVELKDYNQTLVIKRVTQERKGMYRCVVHNKLGEMQMVGAVNVTGKNTYEFT